MRDLPAKWEIAELVNLVPKDKPIVYGIVQAGPEFPGGVPYIKSSDVGGNIDPMSLSRTSPAIAAKYQRSVVCPGDIVFSLRGNIGELSIVPETLPEANLTQGTARISTNGRALNTFVAEALRSPALQRRIEIVSKGSTFREISLEELRRLEIPLPPLPEQRKIAEILCTWDTALEALTTLRKAKARRFEGLRAALLFRKVRITGAWVEWREARLGAVTHELSARNGANGLSRDLVMGVTKAEGLVPMRAQTIAGDISRYKRLPPRAFAYNPMRINVGSIAMNTSGKEVLVSPDYVVFACDVDGLDPDYLDHLRKTAWWAHYINSGGSGSVRQRTYYDDLAALRLLLPSVAEQKAIAEVLSAARHELTLIDAEIEALTRQKRGLMQKLLTGEWRVTPAASDDDHPEKEAHHAQ